MVVDVVEEVVGVGGVKAVVPWNCGSVNWVGLLVSVVWRDGFVGGGVFGGDDSEVEAEGREA